jgi:hypothetical protein
MVMRIESEVFEEQVFEDQFQDQAFEEGKYILWFSCYLAILITFTHMHASNLIYPKDMPRYT